ncbi:MAG: TROVE domain-containing protein [Planctomycetales bacterium]|nr:TROVE domain-containing protein [Planctomycetales bacterium]
MANKSLFSSLRGILSPCVDATNEAGGVAYQRSDKQALAQLAATGCLGATFYVSAEGQLDAVLQHAQQVEPEYLARVALYARQTGYMKDMPALLCAVLSVRSPGLLAEIFDRVIDSPKMLRNFVQIMRSGVVGRKSLGTLPKRLVLRWLSARSDEQLFTGSIGADPSLADVLRMVHPKPASASREALYGYLIGRQYNREALPELVRQYEAFKVQTTSRANVIPDVPFQMLTSLRLAKRDWMQIARNASWQMTRMNLNTFQRHGVFEDRALVKQIANRLRNPQLIAKARVFPYQLMVAYANADPALPYAVREALQDAMELAIKNAPRIPGKVYVCPDVSGSMHTPVTGRRGGGTTTVRCLDVAALVAATLLRKNPAAEVIPFKEDIVDIRLNGRDTVLTNADRIANVSPGGTNCSAPLCELNRRRAKGDLVVFVSDNESWIDSPVYGRFGGNRTKTMNEWSKFKTRNPQARMICIDIQPHGTIQANERDDIVNIGGFSDHVFHLIAEVAAGHYSVDHWVRQIEGVRL